MLSYIIPLLFFSTALSHPLDTLSHLTRSPRKEMALPPKTKEVVAFFQALPKNIVHLPNVLDLPNEERIHIVNQMAASVARLQTLFTCNPSPRARRFLRMFFRMYRPLTERQILPHSGASRLIKRHELEFIRSRIASLTAQLEKTMLLIPRNDSITLQMAYDIMVVNTHFQKIFIPVAFPRVSRLKELCFHITHDPVVTLRIIIGATLIGLGIGTFLGLKARKASRTAQAAAQEARRHAAQVQHDANAALQDAHQIIEDTQHRYEQLAQLFAEQHGDLLVRIEQEANLQPGEGFAKLLEFIELGLGRPLPEDNHAERLLPAVQLAVDMKTPHLSPGQAGFFSTMKEAFRRSTSDPQPPVAPTPTMGSAPLRHPRIAVLRGQARHGSATPPILPRTTSQPASFAGTLVALRARQGRMDLGNLRIVTSHHVTPAGTPRSGRRLSLK